jgi:hypothetical protein
MTSGIVNNDLFYRQQCLYTVNNDISGLRQAWVPVISKQRAQALHLWCERFLRRTIEGPSQDGLKIKAHCNNADNLHDCNNAANFQPQRGGDLMKEDP